MRTYLLRHPGACMILTALNLADIAYKLALREPLRKALGIEARCTSR